MSSPPSDPHGPSRITHGAVMVLAHLYETDASCRDLYHETSLAESTAYRWVTELEEAGFLDGEATRRGGRSVVEYSLEDDELGAAARVLVDRLVDSDTEM